MVKKYVIDSSIGFGTGLPEEPKKFPWWLLLLATPLFLIKKKK